MVSARGAVMAHSPRKATVPTPAHTITLEPRFCLRSSTVWLKLQGVPAVPGLLERLLEPKPVLVRAVSLAGFASGLSAACLEGALPKVVGEFSASGVDGGSPTRSMGLRRDCVFAGLRGVRIQSIQRS